MEACMTTLANSIETNQIICELIKIDQLNITITIKNIIQLLKRNSNNNRDYKPLHNSQTIGN